MWLEKKKKQQKRQLQSASGGVHYSKHDKDWAQAAKDGLPIISGVFWQRETSLFPALEMCQTCDIL